ncbi:bifunctional homocysteine S-methyltransferase/methylenetetrahydrofolate reductase [Alkalihalobacterium alkalinitrilicum]|uniref:bifunctional homocysteine S-methyltransferase/methylenetetrahydrofolate reductase n=1 Tax=Alkalihalobacterium alkalinitrilicum TaxID=427920 RepID=UPI000995330D|nr:bifunctional homocysteine S-methyltransferase/methylenetetrahydrofolate reductase [Alkalihalobacterium alkalinitrilicum]
MDFLDALKERILIGDGAIGTLLYSKGITESCFEHLNITAEDKVYEVHEEYLQAGANVIQTNTYAANSIKLANYGLEQKVTELNVKGVEIAKKAVRNLEAYVLATVGGISGLQTKNVTQEEIMSSFDKQLDALLSANPDGLLFETFYSLDELKSVIKIARAKTDKPIVAQVALGDIGVLYGGTPVSEALKTLIDTGANIVGLNCRMGPYHMIRSLEDVPLYDNAFLSCYPNASLPDYEDGRFYYQSNPNYFGENALRFREQGVRLLGGCCGTTPEHIRTMAKALKEYPPITEKDIKKKQLVIQVSKDRKDKEIPIDEIAKKRTAIIVELDPPKQLHVNKFLDGAKALHEAGVDAVTLADNSLASPRVDNMALGALMHSQVGVRPLVHLTCRDRNLIGLQSHLMGLHTLGMNQVLAITGDPTKVGDFPGASSVYDLTSFDLISLIKQLNDGVSFSGKSLGQQANFTVGAAFNPNVRSLEKAVIRMEKKITAGADYFMTQPVYSEQQIVDVYEATRHIKKPIYIGIMPLTSSRNAEFLHNEVPGIKLTEDIRKRMAACGEDKARAEIEGLKIATSLIDKAIKYFNGIYLITPFLRYEMTVTLTQYIHEQVKRTNSLQNQV